MLDIFQPVEKLELSKGGFAEDNRRLRGDVQNIAKDFSIVSYRKLTPMSEHDIQMKVNQDLRENLHEVGKAFKEEFNKVKQHTK